MPIKNGLISVASITSSPNLIMTFESTGPIVIAARVPISIVQIGVTNISTFVSPATSLPTSTASIPANHAPTAPPISLPI